MGHAGFEATQQFVRLVMEGEDFLHVFGGTDTSDCFAVSATVSIDGCS